MDDRSRLLELIRSNRPNYVHFFEGLSDPSWLGLLAEEGFFGDPPPPEEGEDWVRFPDWPESSYLARVAAADPGKVAKIALAIPPTDNERVLADLAEIGGALSARPAAQIAERLRRWLVEHRARLTLPSALASLVCHLAEVGEVGAAVVLAEALLRIEGEERPGVYEPRIEPVGRIDRWDFSEALGRMLPALLAADRDRAIGFTCDLLARAVELEAGTEGTDYTYIIRPSIADHAQNNDLGLIDVLISALRDATLEAADGAEATTAVLELLAERQQPVFARLGLHLVTECGSAEQVFAALDDPEAAGSVALWHEYSELLSNRFPDLDPEQRERVLGLLASEESERLEDESTEEAERRRRRRLLERLAMIASTLEDRWLYTYSQLVDEFGEPEHPSFRSHIATFTGPTSPLSAAELGELGPMRALEALAAWEPTGAFEDPTPEGFARALEEAVKNEPRPYAEIATSFQALEPTYVRGLIAGLWAALREERPFPWPAVLDLSAWVLAQPFDAEAGRDEVDRDPGWSWSRKTIADLLSAALAEGSVEAPIEEREAIFALLAELCEDPNPTPEHEERYGGKNMDPATLALNTTRGEAIAGLVRYVLWVARQLPTEDAGMETVPEAREILERHLNPAIDPSLAVRSVYGRWWAALHNLDRAWLAANMGRIFPAGAEEAGLFAAAFDAFLAFTVPWPGGFDLLGPAYRIAAERAGEEPRSRSFHGDPRTRLGDHLIALRAYGTIDLEPGGLLDLFWSAAPAAIRGAVVRSAGWMIERTEASDPLIFTRLAETWEWIAAREDGEDADEVLKGFGAWLAAPNLDPGWLIEQALGIVDRRIALDPDFAAYASLPRLAARDQSRALALLRGMLEAEGGRPWAPYGSREEIRELLEATLESPDLAVRREARRMVDQLVGLGLNELRDLVSPSG